MTQNDKTDEIITKLYHWVTTYKDQPVVRDTTKLKNTGYDGYIDSTLTSPLSFTVFELSDKGELVIDRQQKVLESKAAFFIFVNPKTGWIFTVKNTLENQKKLLSGEPLQNFKIKIML